MGRDGYSKYYDYLTIEGGWVNINRMAHEMKVSEDAVLIAMKRARKTRQIEERKFPGYPKEWRAV